MRHIKKIKYIIDIKINIFISINIIGKLKYILVYIFKVNLLVSY